MWMGIISLGWEIAGSNPSQDSRTQAEMVQDSAACWKARKAWDGCVVCVCGGVISGHLPPQGQSRRRKGLWSWKRENQHSFAFQRAAVKTYHFLWDSPALLLQFPVLHTIHTLIFLYIIYHIKQDLNQLSQQPETSTLPQHYQVSR